MSNFAAGLNSFMTIPKNVHFLVREPDFHTGPYFTGFQPVKLVPVLKLKEATCGTQKSSSLTSLIVVLTILLAKMKCYKSYYKQDQNVKKISQQELIHC